MTEPKTGRPWMPGYGVPDDLEGAMPWSWARDRLEKCRNYFLATTRPDGRPHIMPLWGVWLRNEFVFSTAKTSVKSLNLFKNPHCAITIEDGRHSVMVEGTAETRELDDLPGFVDAYTDKYGHLMESAGPVWVMTPTVAFAIREDETFSTSATRWVF